MILAKLDKALILDKPSGVATHTPDQGLTPGFLEMASSLLGQPLWAVHRLDRDTSGCLLVSTQSSAVAAWTDALKTGKKKYVFLSHADSDDTLWPFEARIEKTGNHRFEIVQGTPNSFTRFARLGAWGPYYMFEAEIHSGKTHQIRLHAKACRIPIVGDTTYGGIPFSRLMLHAQNLELHGEMYESPRPSLFSEIQKGDSVLKKFLTSLDRRRFLLSHLEDTDCFRLLHREWSKNRDHKLSVEKLGSTLQILNYTEGDFPKPLAEQMTTLSGCTEYLVRHMKNRGKNPSGTNIESHSSTLPSHWTVKEKGITFELRQSHGMSSGLFLDQRENRKRIRETSHNLKVANFFCYTGGFSLAAALGGAREVVSVDTSKPAIEWAKKNFELNGLVPDKYEFFVADSLFFLNTCKKRDRKFDLIILDPPTFSRSKNGVFQIQTDLEKLIDLSLAVANKNARILMTLNDETINHDWLKTTLEKVLTKNKRKFTLEKVIPPYDFEFPLERDTVLKGYWISLDTALKG